MNPVQVKVFLFYLNKNLLFIHVIFKKLIQISDYMYKVVSKVIKHQSIADPCVLCKTRLTGLRSDLPLPPLFNVQRKVRTTRIVELLIHSTFTSINPPVKASSRYCHELKRTNVSAGLVYSEKQSEVKKQPVPFF